MNWESFYDLTASHESHLLDLIFLLSPFVFSIGSTDANEFEIDEVITAIKNEIQTANSSEFGSPNFIIENVDVSLSIASRETQKGALALKIIGFSNEDDINITTLKSHHKLRYSFKPTETSDFSPEIALGLVEPIRRVKFSFRKAFNNSPNINMDGFTFKIELAIVCQSASKIWIIEYASKYWNLIN